MTIATGSPTLRGLSAARTETGPSSRSGGRRPDPHREAISRVFSAMSQMAEWCFARADRISAGYLEHAPDGLCLHVVSKMDEFDFDLNRELAELVVSIVNGGVPVRGDVAPNCAPVCTEEFKPGHPIFKLNL